MTPFPSFLPNLFAGTFPQPVGTFAFPTFGLGYDQALMGGGGIAVAVTDRPEVRVVMAALASPDMGAGTAKFEWPIGLPANSRFDTAKMVNPQMGALVEDVQAAIRSNEFRFDASDAMRPAIGQGAFWAGMVRLFRDGSLDNLDQLSLDIARDIEAVWLELERSPAPPDQ